MPDTDRPNMYVLLDLPIDVTADRLRYVYEQHVADAARVPDHRRLLRLSRAFDGLPHSVRAQMYPKMASASASTSTSWRDERRPLYGTGPGTATVGDRDSVRQPSGRRNVTRPLSWRGVTAILLAVSAVGFVKFAHDTHLFGTRAGVSTAQAEAVPRDPRVDAQAIANDLNRQDSRDDISCFPDDPSTQSVLTCRASDGTTWAVAVNAPPSGYTARLIQRSTFHQSAYVDAWSTVQSVRRCKHMTSGRLPASVQDEVGQVRMTCAEVVLTQYLHPGNQVDYTRLSPTRFRVEVTASNGETVTYDSRTGAYDPPR